MLESIFGERTSIHPLFITDNLEDQLHSKTNESIGNDGENVTVENGSGNIGSNALDRYGTRESEAAEDIQVDLDEWNFGLDTNFEVDGVSSTAQVDRAETTENPVNIVPSHQTETSTGSSRSPSLEAPQKTNVSRFRRSLSNLPESSDGFKSPKSGRHANAAEAIAHALVVRTDAMKEKLIEESKWKHEEMLLFGSENWI